MYWNKNRCGLRSKLIFIISFFKTQIVYPLLFIWGHVYMRFWLTDGIRWKTAKNASRTDQRFRWNVNDHRKRPSFIASFRRFPMYRNRPPQRRPFSVVFIPFTVVYGPLYSTWDDKDAIDFRVSSPKRKNELIILWAFVFLTDTYLFIIELFSS